jgi:phosphoserine phosphatase RsbU/P
MAGRAPPFHPSNMRGQPLLVQPSVNAVPDAADRVIAMIPNGNATPSMHAAICEALLNAVVHGALGLSCEDGEERDPVRFFARIAAAEAGVTRERKVVVYAEPSHTEPGDFVVSIRDPGTGFDWRAALDRIEREDAANRTVPSLELSGRGLRIMLAGAKRVSWNVAGNEVTLVLRRASVAGMSTAAPQDSRKRILVVDDDSAGRRVMRRLLGTDFCVDVAEDGPSALRAFQKNPPDLALIDVQMPGMTGAELVANLRERGALEGTSVILLTASDSDDDLRAAGIEAGAVDFLGKPIGARELIARINRTLAQSKKVRRVERERNALKDSVASAAAIAQALMPPRETAFANATVSALVLPCAAVGGDLVDVHRISQHSWGAFLVDVAGHGLGAALIANAARAILRDHLSEAPTALSDAASALNVRMSEDIWRTQQHAALAGIIVDERTRRLSVLNAGCPPVVVQLRDGTTRLVRSTAPPAGILGDAVYSAELFSLDEVSAVVILSDGITEGFASSADSLGALQRLCGGRPGDWALGLSHDFVASRIERLGVNRDDASMIQVLVQGSDHGGLAS